MTAPAQLPSLANAPWLQAAATQRVLGAIAAGGFEVRCVGGVVRNALMGLPITDIDIATTALPQDVIRLGRAGGLDVVETGLQHGTVTVIVDHHPFEVTTLRRDVATHGRHATVAFTDDWTADAQRRDFTMNALYCDAAGTVHDPIGGYDDLVRRRVRFIGDAAERIAEDYLRILRFFRFTAQYSDGTPDAVGLLACTRGRTGLGQLSKERIHQETSRLLKAPGALDAIVAMQAHGILGEVLPAAPRPNLLARAIEIDTRLGLKADAMVRLAALAVETAEDAQRIGDALKLSRDEREVLDTSGRSAMRLTSAPTGRAARALLYQQGPDRYRRLVLLSWARALEVPTADSSWAEAAMLPNRWTAPKMPVSGADVLAHGIAPGRRVGDALRALETWWIAQDFAPSREELLARLPAP